MQTLNPDACYDAIMDAINLDAHNDVIERASSLLEWLRDDGRMPSNAPQVSNAALRSWLIAVVYCARRYLDGGYK